MTWLGKLLGGDRATPSIMQVMDAERHNYLSVYLHAIEEAKSEHELAVPEVKTELTAFPYPKPYRYYTLDIFTRDGEFGGPIDVNLSSATPFRPIREAWGELKVELHPFVWNGVEFRVDRDPTAESKFVEWVYRWLDCEDAKPKDAALLSAIIHSVTRPKDTNSSWSFSVDFGSAPLDAFVELVEVLRAAGISRMKIGSFDYKVGSDI